ncbi:MAG: TIGR02302 family protein [Alphaproteobacteria bacterium]|nr:TIGR02302 family protein [Alphaproteobacteria bacterium SS10]
MNNPFRTDRETSFRYDEQPRVVKPAVTPELDPQLVRQQQVLSLLPIHRRILTTIALWFEAVWPMLQLPVALLLTWLGLATLGVFEGYPGSGLLALALTIGAAVYTFLRRTSLWHKPDGHDLLRRVEQDNALANRPLTTLTDAPATSGDPVAKALWLKHLASIRKGLTARLTTTVPKTDIARRDPVALRFIAILLAAIGLMIAGSDAERRITNALTFTPVDFSLASAPTNLDAWIAPPDYTGLPPIFLTRAGAEDEEGVNTDDLIAVPSGSIVYARASGERLSVERPPTVLLNGEEIAFEMADPGQFQLTLPIELSDLQLAVAPSEDESGSSEDTNRVTASIQFEARGKELGEWELLVLEDQPPSIVMSDVPTANENQVVEIPYAALDDYGLVRTDAILMLIPEVEGKDIPPTIDRSLGQAIDGQSLGARITTTAREDLIAHPWAGLEVDIQVRAEDALGQTAVSEVERMTLPMRQFTNEVAREIIAHRQTLTLKPITGRDPVIEAMRELGADTDRFGEDPVMIVGLAALATRLRIDMTDEGVSSSQELMWELALRLEDGELGIARRALERAADALADALENDSDLAEQELAELMEEYEAALEEFLQTLQHEMLERFANGEELPEFSPDADFTDLGQLREMLEQMRDMAETGSLDAAREMLAQMEEMLDQMRNAQPPPEETEEQRELRELAERIQELTQDQEELMDDTFRGRPADPIDALRDQLPTGALPPALLEQLQRMPNSLLGDNQSPGERSEQAQRRAEQNLSRSFEQEALRRQLGDIMLDLSDLTDDLPENLGDAERAMSDSAGNLRSNQTARALQSMGEAIEELQELQNDVEDQANQGMAGGPGGQPSLRFGRVPSQRRAPGTEQGLDPLGREPEQDGFGTGSDVEIPSESDVQRARSILEELRRRAGEFERPEEELDYIERLLDRF